MTPISVRKFVTGPIETNTYLVSAGSSCLVVDPSSGCDEPVQAIKEEKLAVCGILLTHCHFDHLLGISEIQEAAEGAEVKVWAHPAERPLLTNAEYNGSFLIGKPTVYNIPIAELAEGDCHIGPFSFHVHHVPGHSPGSCAFVFEGNDSEAPALCFSGDALFAGSIGRFDFSFGDGELLVRSIKNKLLALPDETVVFPGHGGRTTIGREKRMNPFLNGSM